MFPSSRALYQRARTTIPTGATHDGRLIDPFPLYVTRAEGARKWDADGNELVDFWMGHGALVLGHNHPAVTEAVIEQLSRGTHYGAAHELEVDWAEQVARLVPSAEAVRFTSTGTEATMLAFREARAYTGRDLVIRLAGHFHGWHDYVMIGWQYPFDRPGSAGVPKVVGDSMLVAKPDYPASVRRLLQEHPGQVAAVILEPGGGSNGVIPTSPELLTELRELCDEHGALLIFDEVISGFRFSVGGVQSLYGVTPDLTALGKALSGGLPGAAVVGRDDVMRVHESVGGDASVRVRHAGTFNANPLSAAAGIACLDILEHGTAIDDASAAGEELRRRLREVLAARGTAGVVVGDCSAFQILLGDDVEQSLKNMDVREILAAREVRGTALRRAMRTQGVDLMNAGGFLSIAHGDEELERTALAFDAALEMLEAEGLGS
jgi:glutamate-1-semialdehyde 2,1-aminomutase